MSSTVHVVDRDIQYSLSVTPNPIVASFDYFSSSCGSGAAFDVSTTFTVNYPFGWTMDAGNVPSYLSFYPSSGMGITQVEARIDCGAVYPDTINTEFFISCVGALNPNYAVGMQMQMH